MCDRKRKQELLAMWMMTHGPDRKTLLIAEGEPFSQVNTVERICNRVKHQKISEEVLYLLIAVTPDDQVPVYVGRATAVCSRWTKHFSGIQKGKGLYSRWCTLLFTDLMVARYSLILMIIPGSQITSPPIPGFPTTIGAVEYQLVSLMADAYPSMILNHEGRLR
jgi:hypothetical protein